MSITGDAVVTTPPSAQVPETTVIRNWKTPIALAVFTVLFAAVGVTLAPPRVGQVVEGIRMTRDGEVVSASGQIDLDLRPPKELGGSGEGSNPEDKEGYAKLIKVSTVAKMMMMNN